MKRGAPCSSALLKLLRKHIAIVGPFLVVSRVANRSLTSVGGSGLGLWISKQLVTLHGGQIVLQSKKNVGTSRQISSRRTFHLSMLRSLPLLHLGQVVRPSYALDALFRSSKSYADCDQWRCRDDCADGIHNTCANI